MATTIFGTIDVGGNGKEILLNYVNSQLGYTATLDDFDFGVPERIDFNGTKYNTKIALAPKANSGYYGVKTIYYNRIHVSELGKIRCVRGTATKVSHLLQQINEKYGILVSLSDIVDKTLPPPDPADPTGEVEVEFIFKDSSIVFYSGTYITLGEYDPSIVDPDDIEPFVSRYMFFADNVYSLPDLPRNNEDIRPDVKPTILEAFSVVINASGQRQVTADVTNPLNNKFLSVLDYDDNGILRVRNDNLARTESGIPQYEATYKNEGTIHSLDSESLGTLEPVYKGCNNYRNFIVGSFTGEFIYEAYCVDTNGNVYKRSADNTSWEHISAMPGPCDFVLQSAEGTVYGVNKGLYGTGTLYISTDFGQTFSSINISDSSKYVSDDPSIPISIGVGENTRPSAIEILDKIMVGDDIYVLYKVVNRHWIENSGGSQREDIYIFPVVTRIRTSTGSVSSWKIESIEDKDGNKTVFRYNTSNSDPNMPKYYFSLRGSFIANVTGETTRPSIALYCNETLHLLEANKDENIGYLYGYPICGSFFPSQSIYKGSYVAAYSIEEIEDSNIFIDIIEVGTGIPTDKLDKELYYEIAKHRTYNGYYGHGIKFFISIRDGDHRTKWKEIDHLLEPGSYPGTISMYYRNVRHYLSYQPQGYIQRFAFDIIGDSIEPKPDEEFRARIGKHTGYLNYSTFGTCLLTKYVLNHKAEPKLKSLQLLPNSKPVSSFVGKEDAKYALIVDLENYLITNIADYQNVKYLSKYPLGYMIESIKFDTDAERDSFINDPIFIKPDLAPFTIDYTSLVRGKRHDTRTEYGIDYFASIDIKPENVKLATKSLERNLLVSYTVPKDTKNEWLENTEPLTQDKTIYPDNSTYQHVVFKDNFAYKPLVESLYIHPWLVDEHSFILNKYKYINNSRYIEGIHYSHTDIDYDGAVTDVVDLIPNYTLPPSIELVDIRSVVGCFDLKGIICIKDVNDLHKLILIDNNGQIKEYTFPTGFKVEAVWNDTAFFRDYGNLDTAPDFVPVIYYNDKKIIMLGPLYEEIGISIREHTLTIPDDNGNPLVAIPILDFRNEFIFYQKGNSVFRLKYEFDTRVNVITNIRLDRIFSTESWPEMDLYYSAFSEYVAYDLGNKIGPTYYEVPPAGTEITTYCDGEALISVKSDGEGGVYEEIIDEHSVSCGALKEVCTIEVEQFEVTVTPIVKSTVELIDYDVNLAPKCEIEFTGYDVTILSTISFLDYEIHAIEYVEGFKVSHLYPYIVKDDITATTGYNKLLSVKYGPTSHISENITTSSRGGVVSINTPYSVKYSTMEFIPNDEVTVSSRGTIVDNITTPYSVKYTNMEFIPSDAVTIASRGTILPNITTPYKVIYSSYGDNLFNDSITVTNRGNIISIVMEKQ